jgi:DNA-binding NarL/FixJ family response regulator
MSWSLSASTWHWEKVLDDRIYHEPVGGPVLDILIVDDNARFRDILKAMLQSAFPLSRIGCAPEGATALRMIRAKEPDVIFMDIRMPGKNGLVLTGEIKQRNKDVVIIVLTNLDSSEYREAALAKGADFFLSKESAKAEEIQELLGTIIAERESR